MPVALPFPGPAVMTAKHLSRRCQVSPGANSTPTSVESYCCRLFSLYCFFFFNWGILDVHYKFQMYDLVIHNF